MFILRTILSIRLSASAKITRVLLVLLMMGQVAPAGSDEMKVALVAASGTDIEAMSLRDIRRLYLGMKPSNNDSVGNPVLNLQSDELYDEFLKNVMHMTASSYKRKRVKAIFRKGSEEITEIDSLRELNRYLLENRGDVSFVELSVVDDMNNIEVVQILW
jgi:hypothetical protein